MSRDNFFGVTKSVSFSDLITDVHDRDVMLSINGNKENTLQYAKLNGTIGLYWEGEIYRLSFSGISDINPVSTVHLQIEAVYSGQAIHELNISNYLELMPSITGLNDDTKKDIVNAVLAGNIVTIHSAPVDRGAWIGFGYIVFDPRTGSGAYMIDGGNNGGGSSCGDCDKCYASSFSHQYHYAGGSMESCKEFFKDAAKWIYDVAIPFLLIKANWIYGAIVSFFQSLPIIKCILDEGTCQMLIKHSL